MRGNIYNELLEENQTIIAEQYCQQLQRLSTAAARKNSSLIIHKEIILQQGNKHSYTKQMT